MGEQGNQLVQSYTSPWFVKKKKTFLWLINNNGSCQTLHVLSRESLCTYCKSLWRVSSAKYLICKWFSLTEAEIDVRMREEFSKVCFETLLQFSFSNKVSTPQEGYISRMALSVLLKRSQDVLRRYVEDERLSGRCPLPRQQVTEIIFVLKAVSTLMDSLKKTQPENVDGNTWAQVIALYPTLVECITCSSSEVSSALKEALGPFKDFMQPPVSRVQNGES